MTARDRSLERVEGLRMATLPNLVSLVRLLLVVPILLLLARSEPASDRVAILVLLVAGATDLLDGHQIEARHDFRNVEIRFPQPISVLRRIELANIPRSEQQCRVDGPRRDFRQQLRLEPQHAFSGTPLDGRFLAP